MQHSETPSNPAAEIIKLQSVNMKEKKHGCDETNESHFLLYSTMMKITLHDIKTLCSEKFPYLFMTLYSRFC
jgi:hypothetical protein